MMTEKKKTKVDFSKADLVILVCGVALLISIFFFNAWQNVAEKNYQASLTPEERQAIADQKAFEQLKADQANQEFWSNFWIYWWTPIPLWMFLVTLVIMLWTLRRHLWW